jgi:hypothetical protein
MRTTSIITATAIALVAGLGSAPAQDVSVALVRCDATSLQNPTVFLSSDMKPDLSDLTCLDILQVLIAEGFNAMAIPDPLTTMKTQNVPSLWLPSPGIGEDGGKGVLYWQFYRGPTEGTPLPDPPN